MARIDAERNQITLCPEEELLTDCVTVNRVNIVSGEAFETPRYVTVKLRYRQPEQPALVWMEGDQLIIMLDRPQRAPAPGQAAVLYDGDYVLGGGTIIGSSRKMSQMR